MKVNVALLAALVSIICPWSGAAAQTASAKPFIAPIFSDNMVLQRDRPDPVWGWTTPATTVQVALDNHKESVISGADGYWIAQLPAQHAGGPHVVTVTGQQAVTFQNVLEGDV